MAGPMTSAMVVSTTCWPLGSTSIFWCWIPKCTRTPAGKPRNQRPAAAVAKFAARGKGVAKKDLGMLAMSYGNVYVARVAMGADDQQTLNAFLEAEAYDGPSLIIAYSHCIAHGYDMAQGLSQQKKAVQSGYWFLYRYNPRLAGRRQKSAGY